MTKFLVHFSWGFLVACIVPGFYLWKIPFWILSAFVIDWLFFNEPKRSKVPRRHMVYDEDDNLVAHYWE